MFNFLRRSEEQSSDKINLKRFLIYSVGEMFLIVLGILIAFQIDSWSEYRKEERNEIKSYREIKDDLQKTLGDINYDLQRHDSFLRTTLTLRSNLLTKKGSPDSLTYYLNRAARDFQLFPKTGAFEALKSRGMELLTNDTLRLKITDLFQLGITSLEAMGREVSKTRSITNIMEPYLNRHLTISVQPNEAVLIPNSTDSLYYHQKILINREQLLNDKDLLGTLEAVIQIRMFKMGRHVSLGAEIEELIGDIDKELDRLN